MSAKHQGNALKHPVVLGILFSSAAFFTCLLLVFLDQIELADEIHITDALARSIEVGAIGFAIGLVAGVARKSPIIGFAGVLSIALWIYCRMPDIH